MEPAEATTTSDSLLQLGHLLLVLSWILRVGSQVPLQELVSVVGLETRIQHSQPLAVLGNLFPVTLDILQVLREVGKAALKDLAVKSCPHGRLEVDVLSRSVFRMSEDKIGRLL